MMGKIFGFVFVITIFLFYVFFFPFVALFSKILKIKKCPDEN